MNAFFVKEAIVKAGYFDEDFRHPGEEEPELCYRMLKKGYRFEYDSNAVVVHSHRTILRCFFPTGKEAGFFAVCGLKYRE